jgi:ABC-type nitrate/sulfonate/bicarbonate transport system substrate-binding protein
MRISTRLALAVLGIAFFVAPNSAASSAELRKLAIGLSSASVATAPLRLAQSLGLFEKHGLDAHFTVMDNANMATAGLISHSFDVAASGPGELLSAQAHGQKVAVIANVYANLGATLVLAKTAADKLNLAPRAPVMARLKALDGLLIAVPSPTAVYTISIRSAALSAGAHVRFTYVDPSGMQAALESGKVDGYFTSAPLWTYPVVDGSAVVWISGPKGELPSDDMPANTIHLQMMRDFAEGNPALVKDIAAVTEEFSRFVKDNPAAVKAALAKLYPSLPPQVLDLTFAAETPAWDVHPPTVADMKHDIAFVKSSGVNLPQIDAIDPATLIFP